MLNLTAVETQAVAPVYILDFLLRKHKEATVFPLNDTTFHLQTLENKAPNRFYAIESITLLSKTSFIAHCTNHLSIEFIDEDDNSSFYFHLTANSYQLLNLKRELQLTPSISTTLELKTTRNQSANNPPQSFLTAPQLLQALEYHLPLLNNPPCSPIHPLQHCLLQNPTLLWPQKDYNHAYPPLELQTIVSSYSDPTVHAPPARNYALITTTNMSDSGHPDALQLLQPLFNSLLLTPFLPHLPPPNTPKSSLLSFSATLVFKEEPQLRSDGTNTPFPVPLSYALISNSNDQLNPKSHNAKNLPGLYLQIGTQLSQADSPSIAFQLPPNLTINPTTALTTYLSQISQHFTQQYLQLIRNNLLC